MMSFMLAYQRVCPCMIQLLKTKGHFVAKAMLGKNRAQQPHSIAPSLWIFFITYRPGVTTSHLKFDGGSILHIDLPQFLDGQTSMGYSEHLAPPNPMVYRHFFHKQASIPKFLDPKYQIAGQSHISRYIPIYILSAWSALHSIQSS